MAVETINCRHHGERDAVALEEGSDLYICQMCQSEGVRDPAIKQDPATRVATQMAAPLKVPRSRAKGDVVQDQSLPMPPGLAKKMDKEKKGKGPQA